MVIVELCTVHSLLLKYRTCESVKLEGPLTRCHSKGEFCKRCLHHCLRASWVLHFCFFVIHYQQMGNYEISIPRSFDSFAIFDKFYGSPYPCELLLHANVDTFIVFRSAVPIFVAIGETLYLKQPWPTVKTWTSLAIIFGGGVLYVITDYHFTVMAYSWALAYLVSMSIDFVYIKHVVMTIGLNTWGLVLYNNLEAFLLFPLELLIMGELKKLKHDSSEESNWYSLEVLLPVGLSCLFGLSISFFGFSCRKSISATGFTVLGIVNKLLTVVINLVIWENHATLVGTIGLLICMVGGVLYQQSTTKPRPNASDSTTNEEEKLIEMQSSDIEASSKEVVSTQSK
ncbi:hypothetical protein SUGI_0183950 [Cryptomeria japonica]|nr:hypothetical protein SUGI_0183950 [Cryptomeria japonica]